MGAAESPDVLSHDANARANRSAIRSDTFFIENILQYFIFEIAGKKVQDAN